MIRTFEELEHTADWSIRVWGDSLEALFQHAAAAMFQLQGADMAAPPMTSTAVTCQAPDLEALLVTWLNELLFLSETRDLLFTRFDLTIVRQDDAAEGWTLAGDAAGLPGRGPLAHVKAVTYHNIAVQQEAGQWWATVTFDT